MKIKTQVSISIIVFVILAVVITSSFFSSTNQLQEIQKKQQIIDTIEKSSFELYYLENDYIAHGGTRTVERWNAKYAVLTGKLQELTLTDPSQQAVLNSMLKSHAELQTTFLNLVAITGGEQGTESVSASQKVKDFAASTLTGLSQMMMSRSSELSQLVKTETLDVEQRASLIILTSIAVLMVFVLLNFLLINRSVLRSISVLRKGSERIGSGDLDTTIETGSNDELGDLSLAITAMASNLKTVLTSKSNLEKEVFERRRVEKQLRISEGRYRTLFEETLDGICLADAKTGIIIECNQALAAIAGRERAELIGQPQTILHPPQNDHPEISPTFRQHQTDKRGQILETQVVTKSGSIREVEIKANLLNISGQEILQGIFNDITERKRAEEEARNAHDELEASLEELTASEEELQKTLDQLIQNEEKLKESETRYREFFTTSRDCVFITSPDGRMIDFNDATLEMFGYDNREEISKVSVSSLYARSEDRSVFLNLIVRDGYVKEFPAPLKRRDGTVIDTLITAVSQKNPDGTIKALIGTARDITERKRIEEALRESEERYRNVVEDQTEFICRFLPDCTHIFVNDAYCRYFNRKREEIIGYRFSPVLHPEDRENIARHLASLTPEHPVIDIDHQTIVPDGSIRWQRWSDRAIFGEDGRVIEYQSVGRDITEQKELELERDYHEQELTQFSTSLAVANKKLNLLSSITRHDITNQLTVLVGYLLILEKKQPDTSYAEYFQKINTSSQRISAMIRFTKEYEKIGVNAPSWQDCRTLVDTAAKQAPLGKIMVKNDLPAGTTVFADPLITRVFYNLMDNAVRYGGKITTIRFSAEESGDNPLIVCEDDGDGVPAEEKEKIFERGFGKNTGLGLALSREILSITGITIHETGEPGVGARFEITVPKEAWRMAGKGA